MNADLDLVTVLVTHDSFALSLAKASLDEANIPYVVTAEMPDYLPGFHGGSGIGATRTPLWESLAEIKVARDREADALSLLEPLRFECSARSSRNVGQQ